MNGLMSGGCHTNWEETGDLMSACFAASAVLALCVLGTSCGQWNQAQQQTRILQS